MLQSPVRRDRRVARVVVVTLLAALAFGTLRALFDALPEFLASLR